MKTKIIRITSAAAVVISFVAAILTLFSCVQTDPINVESENIRMLKAAETYGYTILNLIEKQEGQYKRYEVIFGEHPVIKTYIGSYPDGIEKLILHSKTDGITAAYFNGSEYVFTIQNMSPLRFKKTEVPTDDDDIYPTIAVKMLEAAHKHGYTLDNAVEPNTDSILLTFRSHPIVESFIMEYPDGIEQLVLSRKKDRIRGFEDYNTYVRIKTDTLPEMDFYYHHELKVTPLDSSIVKAFPRETVRFRYIIENESEYLYTEHTNGHLQMTESKDTLILHTSIDKEPVSMTLYVKNPLFEYRDTVTAIPYNLTSGSERNIITGIESEKYEIDVATNLPEEMLILEWEGDALEEVRYDYSEGKIYAFVSENKTIVERTGIIKLYEKENRIDPLEWTINQTFKNEKREGYVWFEDEKFRNHVITHYDTDDDGLLSYAEAEAIEYLDASGIGMKVATGIEMMKNLRFLDLSGNNLESDRSLDLSDPHYYLTDIKLGIVSEVDFSGCPSFVWLNEEAYISDIKCTKHHTVYHPVKGIYWPSGAYEGLLKTAFTEDTYISTDLSMEGERVYLQRHTRGKGIELIFHFHGLTDIDYNIGIMERIGADYMEEIFSFEPFKTFRDCFDFVCIKHVKPKREDGIGFGGNTYYIEGKFYPIEEMELDLEIINIFSYASTPKGVSIQHTYNHPRRTVIHEFGHQFSNLGDEYVLPGNESKIFWRAGESDNLYSGSSDYKYWEYNVSLTNDPNKVPWRRFLKMEKYKNEIGIFEGAWHYGLGVYRASEKSIMNAQNLKEDCFNAPSRYSIFQEIMRRSELMGDLKTDIRTNEYPPEIEKKLWEAFLEYDVINIK